MREPLCGMASMPCPVLRHVRNIIVQHCASLVERLQRDRFDLRGVGDGLAHIRTHSILEVH